VLPISGNNGQRLLAELGRGDRAEANDEVWFDPEAEPSATLLDPADSRGLVIVFAELGPAVSVTRNKGASMMGRIGASYLFPIPLRIELAVRQAAFAIPAGGGGFAEAAVEGLVSLDFAPFELGLSTGYQSFANSHTGWTIGQYLRAGHRDGLFVELRARFMPLNSDFFGGIEGRQIIPMVPRLSLSLAGGGGSGVGFGHVGVEIHVTGQGRRGTLLLNPALGFQHVQWDTSDEGADRFHALTGPSVVLRVEWRP